MTLIAYHNDPAVKAGILAQLEAHRAADEIVKGRYWAAGKGCAVGCAIHSSDHMLYEILFGIPVMLAQLEDAIFEGLPNETDKDWPIWFMGTIQPGQDLSLVGWRFLHWLLTDKAVNPGIAHPLVCDAVKQCADVLASKCDGMPVDGLLAQASARAAWSARAARAARATWSAAEWTTWTTWTTLGAAESARLAVSAAIAATEATEARLAAQLGELSL